MCVLLTTLLCPAEIASHKVCCGGQALVTLVGRRSDLGKTSLAGKEVRKRGISRNHGGQRLGSYHDHVGALVGPGGETIVLAPRSAAAPARGSASEIPCCPVLSVLARPSGRRVTRRLGGLGPSNGSR